MASKVFLFALSGNSTSSPCKMKLKDENGQHAILNDSTKSAAFGGGHDMYVDESIDIRKVRLKNRYN